MPDTFTILWTIDRCRWLQKVRDSGPIEVIFGGPHTSQPSLEAVRVGDTLVPVAVMDGALHLLARLEVTQFLPPDGFVRQRFGLEAGPSEMWDTRFQELKRSHPEVGHRVPITCADVAAVGSGSSIRFDRILPSSSLESLRLGPKPGREKPIRGIVDGRLQNNLSFQGHVRRLSAESAALLIEPFASR